MSSGDPEVYAPSRYRRLAHPGGQDRHRNASRVDLGGDLAGSARGPLSAILDGASSLYCLAGASNGERTQTEDATEN